MTLRYSTSLLALGLLAAGLAHAQPAAPAHQHLHIDSDIGYLYWRQDGRALDLSNGKGGIVVDYARAAPLPGLDSGDTIVALDGSAVTRIADLQRRLRALHGAPARLSLRAADGSRRQLRVVAADYTPLLPPPPPSAPPAPGAPPAPPAPPAG
ncbi:MAG: hypothetical protein QM601_04370 [Pseudoxanthomonas sp.]